MLKLANWLWAVLKNGDRFNSLEVIETHKNIAKSRGDEMDWERMGGKEIENAWLTFRTLAPSILNYVRRHLYFKSITQLATGNWQPKHAVLSIFQSIKRALVFCLFVPLY